jgi:hypothetical protein
VALAGREELRHDPLQAAGTLRGPQDPYPTGVKVSDAGLGAVPLARHDWHGGWNYTIAGATARTTAA